MVWSAFRRESIVRRLEVEKVAKVGVWSKRWGPSA